MALLDQNLVTVTTTTGLHKPEDQSAVPAPEEVRPLALLVVDGNRVSRKVYSRLLQKHFGGCHISETETGEKALTMCREGVVDCVLVDYNLPDINGLEFLQSLREELGLGFIAVVILTSQGDEMTAVEAMKRGAQDYLVKGSFSQKLMAQAITNAMEKVELLKELEQKRIDLERKNVELQQTNEELNRTQRQLIDAAHKAGMAEMATGVLHNIGNMLNNLTTAVGVLDEMVKNSRLGGLKKANQLLETFADDLEQRPKGPQLMQYYRRLEGIRTEEFTRFSSEITSLNERIDLLSKGVMAQRKYASLEYHVEKVTIKDLVQDAILLKATSGTDDAGGVEIVEDYQTDQPIECVKIKILHVLTNLILNARESLRQVARPEGDKVIRITVEQEEDAFLCITVADNGTGIEAENLEKIFHYGFTTKPNGSGIGLHVAANSMTEMGGSLRVVSEGNNQGAEFIVRVPVKVRAKVGS
ncbi:hybrid sensor histidine kinase/response regulator [Acanthopleuribacter pedis]|uniref:histidine kinase n=1 Tax=Acanthopleuribacter pedis TaxID=442870 RepID=A0A8J7U664_9BACT|nr:hybrid sensor histidine kinase/response regulator [Acanthopleuribacter pedis]MBO1321584.1 response regulator [Acanthopleuribacter pedis]